MNAYQTIRNAGIASGLAVSGNAMAKGITPDDLMNKILQYGEVVVEQEITITDGKRKEGSAYTIEGFPKLDAVFPKGLTLSPTESVRNLRVTYNDVLSNGPSYGDEIYLLLENNLSSGESNTVGFKFIRGFAGGYTSWFSSEGGEVWQKCKKEEVRDAKNSLVNTILSIAIEEDLQNKKN